MNIAERIDAIKDLIKKREDIDRRLESLFNGGSASTRKLTCSICGSEEHTARKCPNKEKTAAAPETPTTPKSTMQFL
jgi:hypothetical protein